MENWETITRKWRQNAKKKAVSHWETAGNSGKQVKNRETDLRKNRETRTVNASGYYFSYFVGRDNRIWETRNWETELLMNRRKFGVYFAMALVKTISNHIIYNFISNTKNRPI